jgi:hypothetical protein
MTDLRARSIGFLRLNSGYKTELLSRDVIRLTERFRWKKKCECFSLARHQDWRQATRMGRGDHLKVTPKEVRS